MVEIRKYIIIVHRDRDSENWSVGDMSDKDACDIKLKLDFLSPGTSYKAIICKGGPDAECDKNPYSMTIEQQVANNETILNLHLVKSGGFAIQLACLK